MDDTQTIALRPPVWALLLAVLVGGVFYLGGKYIEAKDHTPTVISVSGEGKVSGAPDIAELTFGVQTGRQITAKQAMEMLTENMTKILDAVKATDIPEKDISTENFYLQPQYDWIEGRQVSRGYEAQQTLRVKVRNLDKVSDVLGAATAAGANQAGDVNFTMDNPETLRAQAREKAIAQAKEKAVKLAGDLGMRLGALKGFNEGYGSVPVPMRASFKTMDSAEEAAVDYAVPLPAGEQDVTSNVTLTYELK